MSLLESDSDSDSDYAPDVNEKEEINDETVKAISIIPPSRKRKAAAVFEEMVAQENDEVKKKMHQTVAFKTGSVKKECKSKRKKKKRLKEVLSTVFGSGSSTFKKFITTAQDSNKLENGEECKQSEDILNAAKELVKKAAKKVTVTETRKYAGQEISIEKTVNPGAAMPPNTSSANNSSTESSLDKVLQDIKGPQAITTVSKSSMDWDVYKDKEGLEEDLADATKEGYLTRKEFLDRCDYRAFEKERDQRLLNASKK